MVCKNCCDSEIDQCIVTKIVIFRLIKFVFVSKKCIFDVKVNEGDVQMFEVCASAQEGWFLMEVSRTSA